MIICAHSITAETEIIMVWTLTTWSNLFKQVGLPSFRETIDLCLRLYVFWPPHMFWMCAAPQRPDYLIPTTPFMCKSSRWAWFIQLDMIFQCGTERWEFSRSHVRSALDDHLAFSLPLSLFMGTRSHFVLSPLLRNRSEIRPFYRSTHLDFCSVCVCVCVRSFGSSQPAPGNLAWYGRSPLWCHFPFLSGYSQHSTASSRELWELRAGSLAPSQEWASEGQRGWGATSGEGTRWLRSTGWLIFFIKQTNMSRQERMKIDEIIREYRMLEWGSRSSAAWCLFFFTHVCQHLTQVVLNTCESSANGATSPPHGNVLSMKNMEVSKLVQTKVQVNFRYISPQERK